MSEFKPCPLTPALLTLLQTSVNLQSTQDRVLAEWLHLSPLTVKSNFKRIHEALGVHSRDAALLTCLENGWIRLRSNGNDRPGDGEAQ